ncbi:MAG: hypothetical protein KDB16_15750 [Acidimicrobiales bacterium]|nr:hypothetical protein [Acidimicrobiales bacterium]
MSHTQTTTPDLRCGRLDLTTWVDPIVDELGHDPRSAYAEMFWLPVVGPSTLWFARAAVARIDGSEPDELIPVDVSDTAASLGLAWNGGINSPFARTVMRAIRFGFARPIGSHSLAVRRRLAPLSHRQVQRLPERLREAHVRWANGLDARAGVGQKFSTSCNSVRTPNPVPPLGQMAEASSVEAGPAMSR